MKQKDVIKAGKREHEMELARLMGKPDLIVWAIF